MADATVDEETRKPSKLPLIIGVLLALLGGGGGFYAVYSGMLLGGESAAGADEHAAQDSYAEAGHGDDHGTEEQAIAIGDVAFVPVDPLVISLGPGSSSRHLRFRAQLEVPSAHERSVRGLMPRVVDVLNSYLRAVETSDLEDPAILVRLRAQMLRRVQIVTGPELVRDLLIMEFVLN